MLVKSTRMLSNDPVSFWKGWPCQPFISEDMVGGAAAGLICVGLGVRMGSALGWVGDFAKITSTSGCGGGTLHRRMHTLLS